jgi:hypothetical protein
MKTTELYSFDELDEATQEKVLDKYRSDIAEMLDDFDSQEFIKTIDAICDKYGCTTGREYTDLTLSDSEYEYYYQNIEDLEGDGDSYGFVLGYVKDHTDFDLNNWGLTGVYTDDAACEYIKKVLDGTERPNSIDKFFDDLGGVIRKQWEDQEYSNYSDDGVIAEEIVANDWEFTADGKRVN